MKKTYSPPASSQRIGETEHTIPSSTAQSVAAYVRTGMAMIYENDKATENEAVERRYREIRRT